MRALAATLLALAALPAAPAAAAQQDPSCPEPRVTQFTLPTEPGRAGTETWVDVDATGAARIELLWPGGEVSAREVRGGDARFTHTFRTAGRKEIVATAIAACGARSGPATLRFAIRPPCAQTRDSTVYEAACDRLLARVFASSAGVTTRATWLSWPCRDVIYPPRRVEPQPQPGPPTARAASCVANPDPSPVDGRVPVARGRSLILTFGVPVTRVRVWLGSRERSLVPLRDIRRLNSTSRRWRVRVPGWVAASHPRLWVDATQGRWVFGVRLQ